MQERRHVAIFINDMHTAGGIQRVAANLVRDLGLHYDMVLLSVEPFDVPAFYDPRLEFRSLEYQRTAGTRIGRWFEFARVGLKLRRFVKENRIDTVLAIWFDWASVAALALPKHVKKVGCEHISFFEATPNMRRFRALTYRYLDAVVALTKADLPLLAPISRAVHLIPNYTQPVTPQPLAEREQILLTVGHLDSRKGIDRLLWGLKQPLLDNPGWKLVVVGGGEKGHVDWGYMDYLSVLVHTLQLTGRIEFHPATKRIDAWYRRASIYVMGSRREGLPMVLIEAKAYGLPIVSFDCPTGPKEIIRPGIDGFLVENDSEEFAEATTQLITNGELRHRMGEAALDDYRQRFSPETVIGKWCDLIEGLHVNASLRAQPEASETGLSQTLA